MLYVTSKLFDHGKIGNDEDYLIWRLGGGMTVEIFDIAVNSDRRKGKGRALVDQLIKMCPRWPAYRIYAITKASNRIAHEFYSELTFRPTPLYNFYGVPDCKNATTIDAIMYVRDLTANP